MKVSYVVDPLQFCAHGKTLHEHSEHYMQTGPQEQEAPTLPGGPLLTHMSHRTSITKHKLKDKMIKNFMMATAEH